MQVCAIRISYLHNVVLKLTKESDNKILSNKTTRLPTKVWFQPALFSLVVVDAALCPSSGIKFSLSSPRYRNDFIQQLTTIMHIIQLSCCCFALNFSKNQKQSIFTCIASEGLIMHMQTHWNHYCIPFMINRWFRQKLKTLSSHK